MINKIVTTYHHSFAGGSKNTSRLLHFLSKRNYDIESYFFQIPQFFSYTNSSVLNNLFIDNNSSEVIDDVFLKNYYSSEQILRAVKHEKDAVLFGANLFPYCNILLDTKIQLQMHQKKLPKLIIHPVGSDVWQIANGLTSRLKWLLDHPLVDNIITYSESFVNEIKQQYSITKNINIVPPIHEREVFFPLNEVTKIERKNELGLNDSVFIMHHHSSMRRIKCPEIVITIAQKAAQIITDKCALIMVGPIPFDKIANLNLTKISHSTKFKYQSELDNLTIYWTDTLTDVQYTLQIADVELNASLHDSFNISLMEAVCCGVPVITSDIVGIRKHIDKSAGGICFPTKRLNFDELNKEINSSNSKEYLFDIDFAISALLEISNKKNSSHKQRMDAAMYFANEFGEDKTIAEFLKNIA